MSNCFDPTLGAGLRINASNTIVGVKQWNGYTYCFDTSPYLGINISPDVISNGIAAIANNFTYYRFTRIVFRYTPSCPTTTSRTLRLAYVPDGGFINEGFTFTYNGMADFEYNWSTPTWSPCNFVINKVPRSCPAYYQKIGTATAGLRETTQGCLLCQWDATPTADLSVGSLVMDFTVEFFGKSVGQGITVHRDDYQHYLEWRNRTVTPNFHDPATAPETACAVEMPVADDEKFEVVDPTATTTPIAPVNIGAMAPVSSRVALDQIHQVRSATCVPVTKRS